MAIRNIASSAVVPARRLFSRMAVMFRSMILYRSLRISRILSSVTESDSLSIFELRLSVTRNSSDSVIFLRCNARLSSSSVIDVESKVRLSSAVIMLRA